MNILIIGGSSGLGLELAKLAIKTDNVYITGRTDPKLQNVEFIKLDLSSTENMAEDVQSVIDRVGKVDALIYAAGFLQEGRITEIDDEKIDDMINVGIRAPIIATKYILQKQGVLKEFIAITSTSQWTPRLLEPVYTAVKAALGAYANSLSLDERVAKTIVAAPSGMTTRFWENADAELHDTSKMLDPHWVAEQIQLLRKGDYEYKFAQILRQPARLVIAEERKTTK